MLLYQKHGENLETNPPTHGCLHPRWQKQHKHKHLSREEWSALWQIEQCSIEPMNAKSSGHMTTLDKWTVRALFLDLKLYLKRTSVVFHSHKLLEGENLTGKQKLVFETDISSITMAMIVANGMCFVQLASQIPQIVVGFGFDDQTDCNCFVSMLKWPMHCNDVSQVTDE